MRCPLRRRGNATFLPGSRFVLLTLLPGFLAPAVAALEWEQRQIETRATAAETETRAEFRFANPGSAPVRILSVEPDCGCTVAAVKEPIVGPGEKGHLSVTFRFGQRTGPQTHRITVKVEGEAVPTVLTLETEIPVALTLRPALVFWQREEPREAKTIHLTMAPGASLRDLKIASLSPAMKVSLQGDPAGQEGILTVQPAADAAAGVTALDLEVSRPGMAARHFSAYARIQGAASPVPGLPVERSAAPLSPTELIAEWNRELVEAIRFESSPPPLSARNLAIFHLAIEEAVNACTPRYHGFLPAEPAPVGTSELAAGLGAAAAAAGDLYPSRGARFAELLAAQTAALPLASVRWGEEVGHRLVRARGLDGATKTVSYLPHSEPGAWRRTPPFFRPPELPSWGGVKPFVLLRADQFRPPGPPAWGSERFAADLREVESLGGAGSTARTPEETEIARFWSDFSYTAMPPGHWNSIARDLALQKKLSLSETARLLALVNTAMADSAIACWEAKYRCNTWRPVTAIQQAERLGVTGLVGNPQWLPLLNTPPHPEYLSGHSVIGGAAAQVLRDYFGTDRMRFVVTSDTTRGVQRTFESFSSAEEECGLSRIYGGIHFRYSVEDGRSCGEAVGAWVSRHLLTPLEEKKS